MSDVRFLRDADNDDFSEHINRHRQAVIPPTMHSASYQVDEAFLLIGIGIGIGMVLMWAIMGVVY